MREFDIVVRTQDGTYNPIDRGIIDDPEMTRKGVEYFDMMSDGTVVLLYHITGDAAKLESLLDAEESALSYDVFEIEDDGLRAHVHLTPDTMVTALIMLKNEYDLIINPPLTIDEDGGLHMSVAGDPDKIRKAAMNRPGSIDIQLEEAENGDVDMVDITTLLTDRQQEVLEVAMEQGYYEIPRQATNEDIAADMDCSTSTVGEHLRKIESRLISEIGPA
ncbi:helix-turn-helix domain-containing protein [Halorientalis salina]|uniref:helix-turn-helix domain-containing protein n=1 Tax=Halorientalis salina TaxID=2932266 RepID=UPI0010AB53AF|nr:helix-turn-helix domain-containing protein [Halorientalis salina]